MMYARKQLSVGILFALGLVLHVGEANSRATVFDDESAWLPEVEELLTADSYSSPESAARALARRLANRIERKATDQALPPVSVQVANLEGAALRSESIERAFREAWQACDARKNATGGVDNGQPAIRVELHPDRAVLPDGKPGLATDVLRLTCNLPQGDVETSVAFVDKPWVEGSGLLEPAEVDQVRVCVRGLAEQPGVPDTGDVLDRAVEQVLLQPVLERTRHRAVLGSAWARELVKDRLTRSIEKSPVVLDRYQQTFYSTVDDTDHVVMTREAVLLDLSDQAMSQLAAPMVRHLNQAQARRVSGFAFGGLGILVSVVVAWIGYYVLNSVTKGYYVWTIRAATATFLVIAMTFAARVAAAIIHAG